MMEKKMITEQTHFFLNKEKWEELCEALDQSPREIPALRQLFSEKTILESQVSGMNNCSMDSHLRGNDIMDFVHK